jgi:hypothetical protein
MTTDEDTGSGVEDLSAVARSATALSVLLDHDVNFRGELKAALEADDIEVQNVLLRRVGCERVPEGGNSSARSKGTTPIADPDRKFCAKVFGWKVCMTVTITVE